MNRIGIVEFTPERRSAACFAIDVLIKKVVGLEPRIYGFVGAKVSKSVKRMCGKNKKKVYRLEDRIEIDVRRYSSSDGWPHRRYLLREKNFQ